MQLNVNGKQHEVDVEETMPLLWVLRDELAITGPKFGCGIAMCGACTVHINGMPARSCSIPVGQVSGQVTTIEGLGTPDAMHVVQAANLCRCGTYPRIRAAVKTAAAKIRESNL